MTNLIKALTIVSLATVVASFPVEDSDLTGCAVTLNGYIYNLSPLTLEEDYET